MGLRPPRPHKLSHPVFEKLLPFHSEVNGTRRLGEHNKQLYGHLPTVHLQMALYCRSIFAMVYVYNRLPQDVVDSPSVSIFQRKLTRMARDACEGGDPNWMHAFARR